MNKTDMLWDIEQIKQLKARYFRFVDTKDIEGFCNVFTNEFDWTWLDEKNQIVKKIHGRAEMREWLEGLSPERISVHNGHMPEIEICDDKTAKGIWAMMDYVEVPGEFNFKGYGHYHEKYLKDENEQWHISEVLVTRLRMDHHQVV